MSPSQKTLKFLRAAGYLAQVVERWNPFAKVRQDLFGVIDIVAAGDGGILGVQACHKSDVSKRRKKILASEGARAWVENNGALWVMGWEKGSTVPKMEVFSLGDFESGSGLQ